MKKFTPYLFIFFGFFLSCNKPVSRKILVMSRGKIDVTDKKITVKDGAGYVEKMIEVEGSEPESFEIKIDESKTIINLPEEKGFYLLNLKKDTLVGSSQLLGVDISSGRTISQEELRIKIDSLISLTKGDNVYLGSRNYFVLPQQLLKVTSNKEAQVYGPYKKIPYELERDKYGNLPEIYKFYTNTEMRELIAKFKKMTY